MGFEITYAKGFEEIVRKLEFNPQYLTNDKEIYEYVLSKAIDMKQDSETITKIEMIFD